MATFETVLLTNAGETLLNRELADQVQLKFTHMAFSSDDYSNTADSDVENLTTLQNTEVTAVPTTSYTNGITKVRAYATNESLNDAVYVKTYALYVTPSDTGQEVLFGVVATQNPDYLPEFNHKQVSQVAYTFNLKISRTDNIHFDDVHDVALTIDDLNNASSNAVSQADSYTDSRLAGAQFSQYAVLGSDVSFASANVNGVQVADVNMLSSVASLANSASANANAYTDGAIASLSGSTNGALQAQGNSINSVANSANNAANSAANAGINAANSADADAKNYANNLANNTYNNALNDAKNYAVQDNHDGTATVNGLNVNFGKYIANCNWDGIFGPGFYSSIGSNGPYGAEFTNVLVISQAGTIGNDSFQIAAAPGHNPQFRQHQGGVWAAWTSFASIIDVNNIVNNAMSGAPVDAKDGSMILNGTDYSIGATISPFQDLFQINKTGVYKSLWGYQNSLTNFPSPDGSATIFCLSAGGSSNGVMLFVIDSWGGMYLSHCVNGTYSPWVNLNMTQIKMCSNEGDAQNQASSSKTPVLCLYPE